APRKLSGRRWRRSRNSPRCLRRPRRSFALLVAGSAVCAHWLRSYSDHALSVGAQTAGVPPGPARGLTEGGHAEAHLGCRTPAAYAGSSKREDLLMPTSSPAQRSGLDVLQIDDQLTQDERLVRDTIRAYTADRVLPHIADWFEAGVLPRELAPELGKLGLLGMHLTGYGCAGMGPVAYGVACRELEAVDSGLRSLVSVQGSLAMYPIWRDGSDGEKGGMRPRRGQ